MWGDGANKQLRWSLVSRLSLILAWGGTAVAGPLPSMDEYQVKAAFLYNFAKFVVWPAPRLGGANDSIEICILGSDPFGDLLDASVHGKRVEGRPFVVRRTPDVRKAFGCHILFVSSSERKKVNAILAEVRSCGILTIGEVEGFAAQGGVINFKLESGRVRFEINVDAAEQQGLRISSKLLSLAEVVKQPRVETR